MENDPIYQQGIQHLERSEWDQAIACFTQLQNSYPNDPRVKQFLETARLRAALGPGLQRQAKAQTRSSWLRRIPLVLAIVVVLALIAGVYQAYQTWALPTQIVNARLARIEQLRKAAEVQIASGQYSSAITTYQEILSQAPDDALAKANLERAKRLDQASQLYAQATQALNSGNPAEAARLLEQLNSLEANYRDASALLEQVKTTQALSEAYDKAVGLIQASQWQDAAQAFEAIRATNSNFKAQEIIDYLFQSYMQLGNQQVKAATTVAEIQVADGYFQKALSARPLDPQADLARRTAEACLDGAAAYQAKDWETTIGKLAVVYEQYPDYLGGKVAQWLYEAYMTSGDDFMAKNDPYKARDRYARAMQLATGESQRADAQKRFQVAESMTTPTPTTRPSPTPIPTGTPLPAGYVAPASARNTAGSTPDPYPFAVVNQTYAPSGNYGQAACQWTGVAGRIYDMQGAPLIASSLGVRVEGPDIVSRVAGSYPVIGPSGWMVQWDAIAKVIKGQVQVYYKDKAASAPIPYTTRGTCYENFLIIDIQQVKPLP